MARTWIDENTPGKRHAGALVATTLALLVAGALTGTERAAAAAEATADKGDLQHVAEVVGAVNSYRAGYTGRGVGIALIDTGVAPVQGLTSGNVVNGPDLSFDRQTGGPAHIDAYGHGTHMASIMAGRDAADSPAGYASGRTWHGIAPDATVVNIKVGAYDGGVDVSQVIAAIDWVVAHKDDPGLNIRVLNLSYGTDAAQSPRIDPLAFAVDNAWRHGIVVVAAAGNDGRSVRRLANPAQNPRVVAVGAADTAGTVSTTDDTVPDFANRGNRQRHADLVAPGVSVLGLRDPNSFVDVANPQARVRERFFRGTGTSQATAVTSGAVALLLQRRPDLTPDQVKALLAGTAAPVRHAGPILRGAGMLNVDAAHGGTSGPRLQQQPVGTGTGTLEGARGTAHVAIDGVPLTGERDVQGAAWDGKAWAARAAAATAWDGDRWNGNRWAGGEAWTGQTWVGQTWVGQTWTGQTWVGQTWVGQTWVGQTWVGQTWVGQTWVGQTWVNQDWGSGGWRSGRWA